MADITIRRNDASRIVDDLSPRKGDIVCIHPDGTFQESAAPGSGIMLLRISDLSHSSAQAYTRDSDRRVHVDITGLSAAQQTSLESGQITTIDEATLAANTTIEPVS